MSTVVTCCPFCGASTGLPHESQEACIAALQEEIAQTRKIVERVKSTPEVRPADDQAAGAPPKPKK